jgi:hypothetical protein
MLSRQNDQVKFPSITTTCPDFWTITGGKCVQPAAGNFNSGTIDFDKTPGYDKTSSTFNFGATAWGSGDAAICKKKKWADKSGVKWDTVTNVNFC